MDKVLFKGMFFYGAQFFRPPNPPVDQRIRDLENVKDLGFNAIKLWVEWNWVNQYENRYNFDEILEIINKAKELNIIIVINLIIEQAPYWVAEKYPESYYVNARGKKIYLQAKPSVPTGGWPGLCFDNLGVKNEAEKFLINSAKILGKADNVKIFDCWNEARIEPVQPTQGELISDQLFCYCSSTLANYRRWLKDNYKTIDNINNKWFRRYREFEDVNPPTNFLDYVEMMEWRKFMTWSISDQMRWRYKVLKENLPNDKLIMSHTVFHGATSGFGLFGCDDYELSYYLDLFGLSLFPLWANFNLFDICCELDITRSMSRGKKCINLELQGGIAGSSPTGLSRSPIPKRNHLRMWNFTDIAFGMKGIMYWQYRSEMLGKESPCFGLVKRDGSFTERSDEASKICNFLNKYFDLFNDFKPIISNAAILVSRDSYYFNFASEGDEIYSISSLKGFYKFLLKNNISIDFLTGTIVKEKIFNYKILFIVLPFVIDEEISKILIKYVEEGGVIISDCAIGMFNKYGISNEVVPSCNLDNLFGLTQDEFRQFDKLNREEVFSEFFSTFNSPYNIKSNPNIYFKGLNELESQKIKMSIFLENYLIKNAKPLFAYKDKIVGTVNKFGKGKAFLFGTLLGQSLFEEDKSTEKTLLKILDSEKVEHFFIDNLIIRKLIYDNLNALIIVNPNIKKIKQIMPFEGKVIKESYDKNFKYEIKNNKLFFEINPMDANCLIY